MSKKQKLYSWSSYFGRQGTLESLFLATEEQLDDLRNCGTVSFSEALGKNSCPEVDFSLEEFIEVTDDAKVIKILKPFLPIGTDLLGTAEEQILIMKDEEELENNLQLAQAIIDDKKEDNESSAR